MAWLGDFYGVEMLARLSRGERFVVVAGGLLLLSLAAFPWHRFELASYLGGDPRRTGLQTPNALQGTLAFLVTVAMVAQVLMTRTTNQTPNPALVKLQPAAGLAVLGTLAWKLASELSSLAVGAYLGILLGGVLAYGGLLMAKEQGSKFR
ncbi:MAG: hypothetical protein ACR2KK_04635 [Acidimicrobiales bacterium]